MPYKTRRSIVWWWAQERVRLVMKAKSILLCGCFIFRSRISLRQAIRQHKREESRRRCCSSEELRVRGLHSLNVPFCEIPPTATIAIENRSFCDRRFECAMMSVSRLVPDFLVLVEHSLDKTNDHRNWMERGGSRGRGGS
jgi:hypothetical protein